MISLSRTISSLECIVCKKPAKVDSNYCTDLCVRKHALTMLALLKKETEGLQLSSRVVVYEKKSGKLLAGKQNLINMYHSFNAKIII